MTLFTSKDSFGIGGYTTGRLRLLEEFVIDVEGLLHTYNYAISIWMIRPCRWHGSTWPEHWKGGRSTSPRRFLLYYRALFSLIACAEPHNRGTCQPLSCAGLHCAGEPVMLGFQYAL